MQVYKLVVVFFMLLPSVYIKSGMNQIKIYSDSAALDAIGYNNCNMHTNGESFLIKEIIDSTMRVFDVGANVGNWTNTVLNSFPAAQVYIFEPIPVVFNILKQKVLSGNVNFFNLALSNKQGIEEFQYYDHHSSLSGLFERPVLFTLLHEKPHIIQVTTDTLDNFCVTHGIDQIDFLKIDTEGAEIAILHGAAQLLKNQHIKYIQFEYGGCYSDAHTTLQEAYRILSSCNYCVYRIVPDGLIHISEWRDALENYQYSNYFAVAQ